MASFNLGEYDGYQLEVPEIDVKKSEVWKSTLDQTYTPDKDQFIYDKFKKDYPKVDIADAAELYKLASRNEKISNWLQLTLIDYVADVKTPRYLTEVLGPKDYSKLEKDLSAYNKTLSDESEEIRRKTESHKKEMARIAENYKKKREEFSNKNIKILTINTTKLPIQLSLAITKYTPADDKAPSQKAYARELLINYQISLLKLLKENSACDIEKIIDESSLK